MTYWMYGQHACEQALKNPNRDIIKVIFLKDCPQLNGRKVLNEKVPIKVFDKLVGKDVPHQGIAVQVSPLNPVPIESFFEKQTCHLLALDQVTDPHNMGAIWRNAAVFGVDGVIVTDRNAPKENAVVAKTASGALEFVPRLEITNLVKTFELLKEHGFWVYGLSEHASQFFHQEKFAKKSIFILGAEGKGMRRLTTDHCDVLLKFQTSEFMQTLNVASASAIALSALFRHR